MVVVKEGSDGSGGCTLVMASTTQGTGPADRGSEYVAILRKTAAVVNLPTGAASEARSSYDG